MRPATIFSLIFCAMLSGVLAFEIVLDVMKGESAGAAALIVDTFFVPPSREAAVDRNLRCIIDTLERFCSESDTGEKRPDRAIAVTEAALNHATAMQLAIVEKNRFMADSSGRVACLADSLVKALGEMAESAYEAQGQADWESGCVRALRIAGGVRRIRAQMHPLLRSAGAVVRAFFRETAFNSSYLRAFERDLEERSEVRASAAPFVRAARYLLFRDPGSRVIKGRGGWLFYRPDVEYLYRPSIFDPRSKTVDYNDRALLEDPLGVIVDFRDQLAQRGVDLLVVIVPGKGSVYPDMVAPGLGPSGMMVTSHSTKVIAALRSRGVKAVDLFAPFVAERLGDAVCRDSFYCARDTHWKSRGVRLAAREVASAVQDFSWYGERHTVQEYIMDTVITERRGDISAMTNLADIRLFGISKDFAPEPVLCLPIRYAGDVTRNGDVKAARPYRDDFRKSRILVLGDSFSRIYQTDEPRSAGWIAHLAFELSEPLSSIVSDGGASTLVREKLARNISVLKGKRLVIWEFVERDLRFGESGWKHVELPQR